MTVTLKLLIISPANISIFTSMDPEKLGDALRKFGLPAKFCFSISYGYRVLPALIDDHGKLTKAIDFNLEFFIKQVAYAKDSGLDAFVLSEHFNTRDYYKMYCDIEKNFDYIDGHYLINGFKVFMGLEVDVRNGGHVILTSHKDNILKLS